VRRLKREQVKAEQYKFDSQAVRPYFEYRRVKQGVMDLTSRMFGITYRAVPDAAVWHPDVEAFDVLEGTRLLGGGTIVATEAAAMDEAVRCREERQARTILFGLTGHGDFDLSSYQRFDARALPEESLSVEVLQSGLASIPTWPDQRPDAAQ